MSSQLETEVRRIWRRLPYRRFGRCADCRRTHDEEGRPLYLAGRTRGALRCLGCFDVWLAGLAPEAVRRVRAAAGLSA